jgi:acetyl/propionyl-CoA carboxylase alpha subunit
LVDAARLYFLEMTRVQVRHAVTGHLTGIKTSKTGIRIAAGEPISFTQRRQGSRLGDQVPHLRRGPRQNLPSPGRSPPPRAPSRECGSTLGIAGRIGRDRLHDPLIAKLCAWGRDREGDRARRALHEYSIEGVKTSLSFHKRVLQERCSSRASSTASFIEDRAPVRAKK